MNICLLNNVSYKGKSCGMQFADGSLFFAKAALGYENITLANNQRTLSITNIFLRAICGLLAFTVLLPLTLVGLIVKSCLKNEQTKAIASASTRQLSLTTTSNSSQSSLQRPATHPATVSIVPTISVTANGSTSATLGKNQSQSISSVRTPYFEVPFIPYKAKVRITGESETREVEIEDLNAEKQFIEEMSATVNGQHKMILMDTEAAKPLWKDDRRFTAFNDAFDMFSHSRSKLTLEDATRWYLNSVILSPKLKKEEALADDILLFKYQSGVSEAFHRREKSSLGDRKTLYFSGTRKYPDKTVEKGEFRDFSKGQNYTALEKGFRFKDGKYTYIDPDRLGVRNSFELYFAEVQNIDGATSLLVLQEGSGFREYIPYYAESPLEVLIKLAQDKSYMIRRTDKGNFGIIQEVFNHPQNKINAKEFLQRLLTPDAQGIAPLFNLHEDALLETLQLAQKHGVKIDLHAVHPASKHTLFTQWLGKKCTSLIKFMLSLDPTIINQKTPEGKTPFAVSLLNNKQKETEALLQAMQSQKISLPKEDEWLRKAFTNDCSFKDEEFRLLSPDLKKEIYSLANANCNVEFVERLNRLGMGTKQLLPVQAPNILSYQMDVLQVGKTLKDYLARLRKENRLLTEDEFSKRDQNSYRDKGYGIERIPGRDFIETTAARLHCDRIKAPKKIAVIDGKEKAIKFSVDKYCQMSSSSLIIYAEQIKESQRFASREEMQQLINVLYETGFNDIHERNFIIAEDGIYIIDTEMKNFSGRGLNVHMSPRMDELFELVKPEDHKWLEDLINAKIEQTEKENKKASDASSQEEIDGDTFGFTRNRSFSFPLPTA